MKITLILILLSIIVISTTIPVYAQAETFPSWVNITIEFWANGDIDDETFLKGIEYLIENEIIKVSLVSFKAQIIDVDNSIYSDNLIYSGFTPDDEIEVSWEPQIDDEFEDKTWAVVHIHEEQIKKDSSGPRQEEEKKQGGGNPNCDNEGITDADSENIDGVVGEDYIVQGFTAIGSSCQDATSSMKINVNDPSSPPTEFKLDADDLPFTFQPDVAGTWTIVVSAQGQSLTRTVEVVGSGGSGGIIANAGDDQPDILEGQDVTLDGSLSTDDIGIVSYSWVKTSGHKSPTITNLPSPPNSEFSAEVTNIPTTGPPTKVYVFTLTVFDVDGNSDSDSVTVTIS